MADKWFEILCDKGADFMKLSELLEKLDVKDLESYKETMRYCNSRVTADEGIPAIIGLDDLTGDRRRVYQGAAADEDLKVLMALGALIFTSLYEQDEEILNSEYPPIAPAMSAVAEKFFRMDNGEVIWYREVVEKFLREEQKRGGRR